MLQTNEPGVGYSVSSFTSAMNAIISHEQSLSGSPSVLLAVPPQSVISGMAPYTAAQIAVAQQSNVGFVNIQDRWGTLYNSASGLWDMGATAPGVHPNDKGARDMYSMIYASLVDPVPFGGGATTTASSVAGLITAGSGVTISGSGTASSPYSIASSGSGSGGGCTSACTFNGITTLAGGATQGALAVTSTNAAGPIITLSGPASGVHMQGMQSDAFGHFLLGDYTAGAYTLKVGTGFAGVGSNQVLGFLPAGLTTDTAAPDTAISRVAAGIMAVGNGSAGDDSGTLTLTTLTAGPKSGSSRTGIFGPAAWAPSYNGLVLNGATSSAASIGVTGGGTSGDPNLYLGAQSSGQVNVLVGGASIGGIGSKGSSIPLVGPATEPTGSCSATGQWVFSQDGHASFCNGSAWVQKL
jgi:hypothetical protein